MKKHVTIVIISVLVVCGVANSWSQKPFWRTTGGPEGGTILSLSNSPRGILYITSYAGEIFRSSDMGVHWKSMNVAGYNGHHTPIVFDSTGKAFAAGWPPLGSRGGGTSWFEINPVEFRGGLVEGLFVNDDNELVVSLTLTFFNDGTWVEQSDGSWKYLNSETFTKTAKHPDGSVWALASSKIMRTIDGGKQWDSVRYSYGPITISIINNGYVFITETDSLSKYYEILTLSTDTGKTWTIVDTIRRGYEQTNIAEMPDGRLMRIELEKLLTSSDGGFHWNEETTDLPPDSEFLDLLRVDSTLFLATAKGIYFSTDVGHVWRRRNAGITATYINSIDIEDSIVWAATDNMGLFRSGDHGETWISVDTLSEMSVFFVARQPRGALFVQTIKRLGSPPSKNPWSDGLYRSTDDGRTWIRSDNGLHGAIRRMIFVDSLRIYAYAGGEPFRSLDGGRSWTQQDAGLRSAFVEELEMDSQGRLFLAANGDGIFRSTNGMESWEDITGPFSNRWVMAVAAGKANRVYCAPLREIYDSKDAGDHWHLSLGSTDLDVRSLAVDRNGYVYAGASRASVILRSTTAGSSWEDVSGGIASRSIKQIRAGTDGYVYVRTYGNGLFRSADRVAVVAPDPDAGPASLPGHGIYPTVVSSNGIAQIHFRVEQESFVRVKIWDRVGREIATVREESFAPGVHTIPVAVAGYSPGVFFYQILDGENSVAGRFVVLR